MRAVSRQGPEVRKIAFFVALCAVLFAFGASAKAQSAKIHRVGFLLVGGASDSPRTRAFREGLHQLGYFEGKNIVIERRAANGKIELLDDLAADIVRLKVDVFVVSGNVVTRAAKKATNTIPIVTTLVSDPVENGFIASLARPGGNVTGLTSLGSELSGKRLELLKEIVPRLSNVVVLGNSSTPGNLQAREQTEGLAKALHLQLTYKDIQNLVDIEAVFKTTSKSRSDAVLMLPNAVLLLHRKVLWI
jgi:putative ABC transport system substrate-binding protein